MAPRRRTLAPLAVFALGCLPPREPDAPPARPPAPTATAPTPIAAPPAPPPPPGQPEAPTVPYTSAEGIDDEIIDDDGSHVIPPPLRSATSPAMTLDDAAFERAARADPASLGSMSIGRPSGG